MSNKAEEMIRLSIQYMKQRFMDTVSLDMESHLSYEASKAIGICFDAGEIQYPVFHELLTDIEDWGMAKTLLEIQRWPTKGAYNNINVA